MIVMEVRRSNLIFLDKKMKLCPMVDVAIPGDCRIREKEIEEV